MGRLQKKMLKKAEWHELVNKESRDEAKKYTSAPPTKKSTSSSKVGRKELVNKESRDEAKKSTSAPPTKKSTSSSKVGRKEDEAPFQFRKKHVKPE